MVFRRPKILVMDDSETALEVTEEALSEGGFEVVTVASAAMLPSLWSRSAPDLALIDVSMPVMDGSSVIEWIRRSNLHRKPMVLYSDQPADRLAALARSCGASGYICKTSDGDRLRSEVARFLGGEALAHADTEQPRVFVVNGDDESRQIVDREAGAQWTFLSGKDECLRALEQQRPNLVLIDLDAAGKGEECCRKIRENQAWADLAVVMLARGDLVAEVIRAWRAGADDFLPKPIVTERLLAKVMAMHGARRAIGSAEQARARPLVFAHRSPYLRNRLGHLLELSGYTMLYAKTPELAVQLAEREQAGITATVLDLAQNPADLYATARRIAAVSKTPIIAVTDSATAKAPKEPGLDLLSLCDQNLPLEMAVGAVNARVRRQMGLRVCERTAFFSYVEFSQGQGWESGFSFDLSVNGIFITTLCPVSEKCELDLKITFPGFGALACRGRVAWANRLGARTTYSYMLGMGVEFIDPSPELQRALQRFATVSKGTR